MLRAGRYPLTPWAATGAAVGLLVLAGAASFAIAIAPTLLLLAHMAAGRLPAETFIRRLATRRARPTATPGPEWRPRRPRPIGAYGPRGGRLLATGLSGRAPPLGA
jgi:hypothetical protein